MWRDIVNMWGIEVEYKGSEMVGYRNAPATKITWFNFCMQVILVGNKCDMEDERVISYERGKHLADSLGLEFFETSAKENINVRVRRCHAD